MMKMMKDWIYISVVVFGLTACTDPATQERIDKLEKRVEALESSSGKPDLHVDHDHSKPTSEIQPKEEEKPLTGPFGQFKFAKEEHDFGQINEGDEVTHVFTFKNIGQAPLVINDAKASCGCTVPRWPKDPIPVGGSGEIEVKFNSKGKKGQTMKTVTIKANTNPAETKLKIKTNIIPAPKLDEGPVKQ